MRKKRVLVAAALAVATTAATAALINAGIESQSQTFAVSFDRGTALEAGQDAALHAVAAAFAKGGDGIQVVISGHTGTLGDEQANQKLSQQRATAVAKKLESLGVDPDRIAAFGLGGGDPLAREDDEANRAWQRRLSRAEITVTRSW